MGGFANDEIPLLVMLFYLFRDVEAGRAPQGACSVLAFKLARPVIYAGDNVRWGVWLGRHIC